MKQKRLVKHRGMSRRRDHLHPRAWRGKRRNYVDRILEDHSLVRGATGQELCPQGMGPLPSSWCRRKNWEKLGKNIPVSLSFSRQCPPLLNATRSREQENPDDVVHRGQPPGTGKERLEPKAPKENYVAQSCMWKMWGTPSTIFTDPLKAIQDGNSFQIRSLNLWWNAMMKQRELVSILKIKFHKICGL